MPDLGGLSGGICGDLGYNGRLNLNERLLRVPAAPALRADLIWPRMLGTCRGQNGAKLGRLRRLERDCAADDDQLAGGGVEACDDDFWAGDRSKDTADDDLSGFAVLDLSLGWIWCRALSY